LIPKPRTLRLSDHERAKEEIFLSGELTVFTRSGLNISETLFLKAHEEWKPCKRVLVIENRSAVLPMALHCRSPETQVDIQCFDHFYYTQIQARLKSWAAPESIRCHLSPDLPNERYSEIFIQVTQSISAEFVAELLQSAYQHLEDEGRLWVSAERQHRHTDSQVQRIFGQVTKRPGKQGSYWIIKKKADLTKVKTHECSFEFGLPSGLSVQLTTKPGVFSHRRVDEGARALAESMSIQTGDRVLEMGCGHGGVGLLAKKMAAQVELILLDSNTRALQMAELNTKANQLEPVEFKLSALGCDEKLNLDVFLGNPPYFSDHIISKLFIDEAAKHLKSGGLMFLVAKVMDWNAEYAKTHFKDLEILSRRGYKVLKAKKN